MPDPAIPVTCQPTFWLRYRPSQEEVGFLLSGAFSRKADAFPTPAQTLSSPIAVFDDEEIGPDNVAERGGHLSE